jgi:hypothetical protein
MGPRRYHAALAKSSVQGPDIRRFEVTVEARRDLGHGVNVLRLNDEFRATAVAPGARMLAT